LLIPYYAKTVREEIKMNNIMNFFLKPSALLDKYIEKPKWVIKWLVYSVLSALVATGTSILARPEIIEMTRQSMLNQGSTQEQIDMALKLVESPLMNYISLASVFFGALIFTFLIVLFYYLAQGLVGGVGTYIQTMAIVTLSYFTTLIGSIIKFIYMYYSHNLVFAALDQNLNSLLMQMIDPFSIWGTVIIVIGFMRVCKISLTKAIIINVIITLGSLGFGYLTLLISGSIK